MANAGNYTHPSYLTRQIAYLGVTTAGANGTSTNGWVAPWDINLHQMQAVVKTAGTSATTGNQVILLAGTATVTGATVVLGSSTAGVYGTTGDIAQKITAGTPLYVKNGTDATGVAYVSVEFNINPVSGTWLGNE